MLALTKKNAVMIKNIKIFFAIILVAAAAVGIFIWNDTRVKILYKAESDFGPIWVYERGDYRCMNFVEPPASTTQSCLLISKPKNLLHNYSKMMMTTLFLEDNPRKILMIGLGGGSMVKALNILVPNAKIDIVEINSALPPIAQEYFNLKVNSNNKIIIEDGFEFVKKTPEKEYDIVLIDAFDKDYIPPTLLTDEFMQNVKKVMKERGVVAINTFTESKYKDVESSLFKNNFGSYYNLVVGGNRVILTVKGKMPELNEIAATSNLWLYRFVEINAGQPALLSLFQGNLK